MKISLCLSLSMILASAMAQEPQTLYAIYGMVATGPKGPVKSVNIGVLPRGILSECQHQVDTYINKINQLNRPQQIDPIPSGCTNKLPNDLSDIILDKPISNAYVTKVSGNWAPIYTAYYGLSLKNSAEVCQTLVERIAQQQRDPQVEVNCLPPK